jgi:hypothetical protein
MRAISELIKETKRELYHYGTVRRNNKWQGIKIEQKLLEIFNIYLAMEMPTTTNQLAEETKANLPWAEDHFQERIGGVPLNPGNEYKNWPFYRGMDNDDKFRKDGEGHQFSHSYMERMWCKQENDEDPLDPCSGGLRHGIRYPYGDFEDFLQKFAQNPYGRQNYFSIWHPEDQSPGDRRLPCTLGYWFNIVGGKLDCTYHIRSCDIFRHFHNDIYMTVRLAQYVRDRLTEEVLPYLQMGNLYMWIGSLHCFEVEKEMLVYKG